MFWMICLVDLWLLVFTVLSVKLSTAGSGGGGGTGTAAQQPNTTPPKLPPNLIFLLIFITNSVDLMQG